MSMDRKIEPPWWRKKRYRWPAGAAAIIAILATVLQAGDGRGGRAVHRSRVRIAEARIGPFRHTIPLTGTFVPIRSVFLDAVEGGRVERVLRDAGTPVAAGDTLLVLSNTDLLLDVMNREAQLLEQRGNLGSARLAVERYTWELKERLLELDGTIDESKRKFRRLEKMVETELVAREEYEEAKDAYDRLVRLRDLTREAREHDLRLRREQVELLEDSVNRIEANLDVLRKTLHSLVVRAPVSGILTALDAEVGESIPRGRRLGQVDVLEGFRVSAEVDEFYIHRVDRGIIGRFESEGREYGIEVEKVYPEVRDGRFRVDLMFTDGEPSEIRRGQTVKFRLALGETTEALLLPRGPFYDDTGGRYAFVVDESGDTARRRPIRVGRQDPEHLEILDGLRPGEEVVISSYRGYENTEILRLTED